MPRACKSLHSRGKEGFPTGVVRGRHQCRTVRTAPLHHLAQNGDSVEQLQRSKRHFFAMYLAMFPRQMTLNHFPADENTGVRRFTHRRQGALFQFDIHHYYARSRRCAARFVGHDVVHSAIEAKGRSRHQQTGSMRKGESGLRMRGSSDLVM